MNKLLGLIFGLLLLGILFYSVDVQVMLSTVKKISLLKFLVFFLFSFVLIAISALKWLELYKLQGIETEYRSVFLWYFFSYFVSMLVPLGFVGTDLARVQMAKKINGYEGAFSTVLQDRYTGFLVMFFFGTILCFLSWRIPPSIAALSAFVFLLGILAPFVSELIPTLRKYAKLSFIYRDFSFGHVKVLVYSALFYLGAVVNIMLGAWVAEFEMTSILDLSALLPLVLLASSLPISPQGLGIQEGFYFFLFQFVGASKEKALLLALLLRGKVLLLGGLAGIVFVTLPWIKKKTQI